MEKNKVIIDLLEVYRSLPALWDVKCKDYTNKYVKNEQYEILLEKYKEQCPNATKKELTQKISSLRTNYRKELKRITSLEKSGAGAPDEIDSNLYYFDAMNFLRKNEEPNTSCSSLDLNETYFECEPRKQKKEDASDELITLAAKQLQQASNPFEKKTEAWAVQLQEMGPQQRIFAEKFVSGILFEGKLGTLHRNAITFNTSVRTSSSLSESRDTPFSYTNTSSSPALVKLPMMSPQIPTNSGKLQYRLLPIPNKPQEVIEIDDNTFVQMEQNSSLANISGTIQETSSQEQPLECNFLNASHYFSNFS